METGPIPNLSPREIDVLRLVRAQRTNKEIGAALGLSPATVGGYVESARGKIGAPDRRAAAQWLADREAAPSELREPSQRVSADPTAPPPIVSGGGRRWLSLLPIRQDGAPNDLSLAARAIWPFGLAVAFAIGFGAFANGAEVVSRFLAALR